MNKIKEFELKFPGALQGEKPHKYALKSRRLSQFINALPISENAKCKIVRALMRVKGLAE